MSKLKNNILATLSYFDHFKYPLTQKEIFLFLPDRCSKDALQLSLYELIEEGVIHTLNEYYSLTNIKTYASRRDEGYTKALKLIATGKKIGRLLSHFPYVKGIAISGSLSKYYAEDDADIDFFIITSSNRVWIARSLTHLLKKLSFVFRQQHLLCMNYYIDESRPEIIEKNIFTATEIVTLMPLTGAAAFNNFFETNRWTQNFLPNQPVRICSCGEIKDSIIKRLTEFCFSGRTGNAIDNWLMNITDKRWQTKTLKKKVNDHGHVMSMTAHKHYSKPDPSVFQVKLLDEYKKRLADIFQKNEAVISRIHS